MKFFTVLACCLVIGACAEDEVSDLPPPVALSASALGHYCQMDLLEHAGPKAQIHLTGFPMPIWFSQVRDGIAYIKSAERTADIVAFYVNDMGSAASWESPGEENWSDANTAFFVVGSDAIGGMGAPELVPFATEQGAKSFVDKRGGKILKLADIKPSLVLAPVEISQNMVGAQ